MLPPAKLCLAILAAAAVPAAPAIYFTRTPEFSPAERGQFAAIEARQAASRAWMATISSSLACSLDRDGVARCTNYRLLRDLGSGGSLILHELQTIYDRQPELDRAATTLLSCGDHYATSNLDLTWALDGFSAALPPNERPDADAAIGAFLESSPDAPLFLPGGMAVAAWQDACNAGTVNGQTQTDPGDRGSIDTMKARMTAQIEGACRVNDEYDLLAWSINWKGVFGAIGEGVKIAKDVFTIWEEVKPATDGNEYEAHYYKVGPFADEEGDHLSGHVVIVESDVADGKLHYSREVDKGKDELGREFTSVRVKCKVDGANSGRECTQAEIDNASKQAKDVEEEAKKEIVNTMRCDAEIGCVNSCDAMRAWWGAFSARCDLSGWQEYACRQFMRKLNHCTDDRLVYPDPDGTYDCVAPVGGAEDAMREECEAQHAILLCTPEEGCGCQDRGPVPGVDVSPRCGPESLCTGDETPIGPPPGHGPPTH